VGREGKGKERRGIGMTQDRKRVEGRERKKRENRR